MSFFFWYGVTVLLFRISRCIVGGGAVEKWVSGSRNIVGLHKIVFDLSSKSGLACLMTYLEKGFKSGACLG